VNRALAKSIAEVRNRMEAGDLLLAFDLAVTNLKRFPGAVGLQHLATLSLARAGASERALQLFREWRLELAEDSHVRALAARLAKDRALSLDGPARQEALADAASLYLHAAGIAVDAYHRINAATLLYLAGRATEAVPLAKAVLTESAGGDYWSVVTRAEAHLLLGDRDAAGAELVRAAAASDRSPGAAASTRRQLRLILAADGERTAAIEEFLSPLAPAPTGFVDVKGAGGRDALPAKTAAALRRQVGEKLAELSPSAVFATLGGPAGIVVAEAAAGSGAELTLVLSSPQAATEGHISAAVGQAWARRFQRLCRKAKRVTNALDDPESSEMHGGDYVSRIAAGLAALRAQHVDGEVIELSLTPAEKTGSRGPSGRVRGGQPFVVHAKRAPARQARPAGPECRAIIFADLPGFSSLPERLLPAFWQVVMAAVGEVVREAGDRVVLANTWGDGVHLIVVDAASAAEICLAMQRRLKAIDVGVLERKDPPVMRIGAHYGPAREGFDPVTLRNTFFGRALARAARIEPVTPAGTVYVTEAFAAILLLEAGAAFNCAYVGEVPLAKGYGAFRMYALAAAPGRSR
jgi:class 3 adenylate cyclase